MRAAETAMMLLGRAAGSGRSTRLSGSDELSGDLVRPSRLDATTALVFVAAAIVMAGAMFGGPIPGPVGLFLITVAAAVGLGILGSPVFAMLVLLFASFLRTAVQVPGLPAEPMVLVLAGLCVSAVLAELRGLVRFRFGTLEAFMTAYLGWNVVSMLWPHTLTATLPGTGQSISVYRFILTGTAVPFIAFVVSRAIYRTPRQVELTLMATVLLAGFSGVTSILQFTGPASLVWPRYILESPVWPGRAVGIFNQPAVNGLLMVAGFVTAMFMIRQSTTPLASRIVVLLCAGACVPGIYLTYTRAVWLVFGVSLLFCAVLAVGARAGFVVTLIGALLFLGLNWTKFTSSDRQSGGVGSTDEVYDRLNTIETSFWAIREKPIFGWGIARFTQVNTYHHQVWEQSVSFARGYGISSHENELGIAVELGLLGLALWLTVLVMLAVALVHGVRRLPADGLYGRALALLALTVLATYVVCGFTIDLRYHDFANLIVFLLAGIAIGAADGVSRDERHREPVTANGAWRS